MANKGLIYEESIRNILIAKGLLPPTLIVNVKDGKADAGFIHDGKEFFLEIKNQTAPDFGSKKIIYDAKYDRWKWNDPDRISQLFNRLGVLKKINDFTPRKYVKADSKLTKTDKKFDRQNFEHRIVDLGMAGRNLLYDYYAEKKCYYIQIEGKGFYHLKRDVADLGVPKFNPTVELRLRAKTHGSDNIANYSFRVVIVSKRETMKESIYDIEGKTKKFPPI
jgi:hypothetical protein